MKREGDAGAGAGARKELMSQLQTTGERDVVPPSYEGFRVTVSPVNQPVRVEFNGETVADSSAVLAMKETRLPQVYYFPREDVRMDLLVPTETRTNCPFKGNASYWSLKVNGRAANNAAWSYEDAFDEAIMVDGYVAFDWAGMDAWYVGGVRVAEPPRDLEPVADNPFFNWLVTDASRSTSARDLLARLARVLISEGFPVWRMRLVIRTLNPLLYALSYRWQRDLDDIEEFEASHELKRSDQYRASPFALIAEGQGGVRRRLEGADPKIDFPVLQDLVDEGATDYVAVPMKFSDGQINILSLISDRPGGFTTNQLGHLYEILPNLSRQLEAHAHKVSAKTLLHTYLGRSAGGRVWDGHVERGDGNDMHAVIWLSDLRGSTEMAESLSREDYLKCLNTYFDCVAGAVMEHGGEVLKFIGDAVLAIFPIDNPETGGDRACLDALAAAKQALRSIGDANAARRDAGKPELRFGIGLHRGDITFGNVGTDNRLDFTVIGSAVNEAARIEELTKSVGRPVLVSQEFSDSVCCELEPVGSFSLRGMQFNRSLFALREDEVG